MKNYRSIEDYSPPSDQVSTRQTVGGSTGSMYDVILSRLVYIEYSMIDYLPLEQSYGSLSIMNMEADMVT